MGRPASHEVQPSCVSPQAPARTADSAAVSVAGRRASQAGSQSARTYVRTSAGLTGWSFIHFWSFICMVHASQSVSQSVSQRSKSCGALFSFQATGRRAKNYILISHLRMAWIATPASLQHPRNCALKPPFETILNSVIAGLLGEGAIPNGTIVDAGAKFGRWACCSEVHRTAASQHMEPHGPGPVAFPM